MQKTFGIRMARASEELLDKGLFDYLTGIHDGDSIRGLSDDTEIMCNQKKGEPTSLSKLGQKIEGLGLDRDVKRCRRLVGNQKLRIACERHRDHRSLTHSTGHLVRVAAHARLGRRNGHIAQSLDRLVPGLATRHLPVQSDGLGNLLTDGIDRVERGHRNLKDHGDLVAAQGSHFALIEIEQVATVEDDLAAGNTPRGGDEPHQSERRCRLSAAGFPDEAESLASFE